MVVWVSGRVGEWWCGWCGLLNDSTTLSSYLYFHVGMTKVKFSKSEENTVEFIERRRASLERYVTIAT